MSFPKKKELKMRGNAVTRKGLKFSRCVFISFGFVFSAKFKLFDLTTRHASITLRMSLLSYDSAAFHPGHAISDRGDRNFNTTVSRAKRVKTYVQQSSTGLTRAERVTSR